LVNCGVDIVQPDVSLSEGLFQVRKIAAMAEVKGRDFIPHTWCGAISFVANLHVAASTPNCRYIEFPYDPPSFPLESWQTLLQSKITIDAGGYIHVPEGHGLGIEPNLNVITQYGVSLPDFLRVS